MHGRQFLLLVLRSDCNLFYRLGEANSALLQELSQYLDVLCLSRLVAHQRLLQRLALVHLQL